MTMRFRFVFLGLGSLLTLALIFLSDPSLKLIKNLPFGSGTLGILIVLTISILYLTLLHLSRKGFLDYLDLEVLFIKAAETPLSAAIALVSVGIMMVAMAVTILAAAVSQLT